ncbi:hypothetical protein SSX86_032979 [Deinandra increscens subsp. villosa]|uniref:AP2/ERF domain-containing protein n=1 Tax=Deinandra increscens subsp. villosa TaxID=3103831 RepID=A0AAP0GG94_9ASTR
MAKQPSSSLAPDRIKSDVKFRGVRKRKWGKWVSEVRLPNSRNRIWLGSYDTPEKAARAFDAAVFCLRGKTASFNFPHQTPDIPGGRSLPPAQIQAAAALYANRGFPAEEDEKYSSSSSVTSTSSPISEGTDRSLRILDDVIYTTNICDTDDTYSGGGVPDFGMFPGFDDYLITTTPSPGADYEEEEMICDGIYGSFLWNF